MRNFNVLSPLSALPSTDYSTPKAAGTPMSRGVSAKSGLRGALAISAVGLLSIGTLAACSPSNEKDSTQSSASGASSSAPTIEQASLDSQDTAVPYTKTDGEMKITVHNLLKPGADIMISSPCGDTDTHAQLTTSLTDAVTDMSPAADLPELIGDIKAPTQIGPGPADGYHTVTVTCDSGQTGTITFNSAGNADLAPQN